MGWWGGGRCTVEDGGGISYVGIGYNATNCCNATVACLPSTLISGTYDIVPCNHWCGFKVSGIRQQVSRSSSTLVVLYPLFCYHLSATPGATQVLQC